jgi:hypothetical protein
VLCIILSLLSSLAPHRGLAAMDQIYSSSKPYTRWWWFASEIEKSDIREQLVWLAQNGFGGVEIAFIYPPYRNPNAPRIAWLSPEWTEAVTFAKQCADSLGLGTDFTFGTLWPFGGTFVPDSDRTIVYGNPEFRQPLALSWSHPDTGNVLDHMKREAFERYASVMGAALRPALAGSVSAFFCDSWEVETRKIWTEGFGEEFENRFGYDVRPFMEDIYSRENADARYDYMKLVSEYVIRNFYVPFTETCHSLGAVSRVQCAGSPTDLITAYASADIPETEAMLYEPNFARIVSSAAALSSKRVVSSETFTCLYGFPRAHHLEEQTADLKLVADALFAHGVNQIVWHGMPYNPAGVDTIYFYATVHVGRKGSLSAELSCFNEYMTKVSSIMRRGRTYSDVAVYLPLEDSWMAGEYPPELQMKWSWGAYELRYVHPPEELKGYHPLWVNGHFLEKARIEKGRLRVGDLLFSSLVVDVEYLDSKTLDTVLALAREGLPVCMKRVPREPGRMKSGTYETRLAELFSLGNVSSTNLLDVAASPPLVQGSDLPDFWCRVDGDIHYIFFSHPKARNLTFPLSYGESRTDEAVERVVTITAGGRSRQVSLRFEPYESLLLEVDEEGGARFIDISFRPKMPVVGE